MPRNTARSLEGGQPYVAGLSVARGFQLIMMVVLFHILEGLVRADTPMPHGFWESQILMEPLRMPVFFLISGVLMHRLLNRSLLDQLRSRVTDLIWPMIIGHYVIISMQWMASGQTNGKMTFSDLPFLPLPPYAHLWFLWAMILISVAIILVHAALRRFGYERHTGVVTLSAALLLQGEIVPDYLNGWWFDRVIADAPYMPLGMLLGPMLTTTVLSRSQVRLFILLGLAAAVSAILLDGVLQVIAVMLASVLFLWVVCSVCTTEGHTLMARATRFWAYLGDRSLAIYLYHILWTSGGRIGLSVLFGVTAWQVVIPVTLILGTFGPLLMLWVVDKVSEALHTKRATVRLWTGLSAH